MIPPLQFRQNLICPQMINHLEKYVLSQSLLPLKARGRGGEEKVPAGGGEVSCSLKNRVLFVFDEKVGKIKKMES